MLLELSVAWLLVLSPPACKLVTRQDASKTFGGAYAFQESATASGRGTSGGTVVSTHSWICEYAAFANPGKPSLEIRVNEFASPAMAHRALPKWMARFGAVGRNVTTSIVENLGDEASLLRAPSIAAICVRRGDTLVMIDVWPATADETLRSLAKLALGRL
ncbi:MAG: hypothetical protein M3Y05_17215 [Gemmatimonadota bacterium]|nr:hypothetical protein [Gemmatimonadota bacterium]